MADATDDGGLRGSLSPETLAFYEDAFGTMDPSNGQVAPQQFLDLIKIVGVDANIDTAAKVINDCGGLDFDSFLELVQDCDSSSVTAFRRSFRSTVEQRIKDIEGREAASANNASTRPFFVKAEAEPSTPPPQPGVRRAARARFTGGVEEIAKGLRDEGDLVEEQARSGVDLGRACFWMTTMTVCRKVPEAVRGPQVGTHRRGDRIQRDDRASAGGGLGLLNDIVDAGWRIKNEKLQAGGGRTIGRRKRDAGAGP